MRQAVFQIDGALTEEKKAQQVADLFQGLDQVVTSEDEKSRAEDEAGRQAERTKLTTLKSAVEKNRKSETETLTGDESTALNTLTEARTKKANSQERAKNEDNQLLMMDAIDFAPEQDAVFHQRVLQALRAHKTDNVKSVAISKSLMAKLFEDNHYSRRLGELLRWGKQRMKMPPQAV